MKISDNQKAQFISSVKTTNNALYTSAAGYLKRKLGNRKAPPTTVELYNAINHVKYALERNKVNAAAKLAYEFHDHAAEISDWDSAGFDCK
jgi:hypothetical protein